MLICRPEGGSHSWWRAPVCAASKRTPAEVTCTIWSPTMLPQYSVCNHHTISDLLLTNRLSQQSPVSNTAQAEMEILPFTSRSKSCHINIQSSLLKSCRDCDLAKTQRVCTCCSASKPSISASSSSSSALISKMRVSPTKANTRYVSNLSLLLFCRLQIPLMPAPFDKAHFVESCCKTR